MIFLPEKVLPWRQSFVAGLPGLLGQSAVLDKVLGALLFTVAQLVDS